MRRPAVARDTRALTDAYVAALESRGKKRTAQDVRNLCRLHLSDYGAIPAREITLRDVTAILRAVVEAGKGRTATPTSWDAILRRNALL